METLGSRIATYRHGRKWTQDKLADELGINRSLLSDIENDKISPKLDILDKIAEKLDVPVTNLLPSTQNVIYNNNPTDHAIGNVQNYNNTQNTDAILDVLKRVLETQNRLIALLEKQDGK